MRQTLNVAQVATNSNASENDLEPLVLLPPLLQWRDLQVDSTTPSSHLRVADGARG